MTKDKRKAKCLAVFGTGSDVGKSIVTTALCRYFTDLGIRTAPYKAQNMSNNSGVTPEGLEMGRAQIVQAEAARIAPHVDMNPILLKPTSDVGSQVVLMGRAIENSTAKDYHEKKERLFSAACDALDRLRDDYDLVIMEGAGSCAEVNLMPHDIVNFRMAEYAEAPVILVGDIHRGGIFAQLVGTLNCLPEDKQQRIAGFIVNRFRGDLSLFENGVDWIKNNSGKPVFGVLPWYSDIFIDPEDSVAIESPKPVNAQSVKSPAVGVIRIPHIANFTDFDPLLQIDDLNLHFIEQVQDLSVFKAVIIPGSKNTRWDLDWLKSSGWAKRLTDYERSGGHILGICGGYQMMGQYVEDPDGVEGAPGTTEGLGLLPINTVLKAPKTTTRTRFAWDTQTGMGYEIHMGQTRLTDGLSLFSVTERNSNRTEDQDGCVTQNGRIMGTYIHGMFENPGITGKWLSSVGMTEVRVPETGGLDAKDHQYSRLVDHFIKHIDIKTISQLIEITLPE